MFFQRRKKRLWRACVKPPATPAVTNTTQHLHQHRNQQPHQHQQMQVPVPIEPFQGNQHMTYCCQNSSFPVHHHPHHPHQYQQEHMDSQVHSSECNLSSSWQHSGIAGNICGMRYASIPENAGFYSESGGASGAVVTDFDDDQTMSSVASTKTIYSTSSRLASPDPAQDLKTTPPCQSPMAVATSTAVTMATTAAVNVFRNCCGCGSPSESSSRGSTKSPETSTRLALNNKMEKDGGAIGIVDLTTYENEQKVLFRALVGKLKESQITTLLQAVGNGTGVGSVLDQTDCVLVPRGAIMDMEPNVIACRLWRWWDLRNLNEIKRIPSCPNEKDPVYICCNPSHWSRLCSYDIPPPPYQYFAMDGLKTEDRVPSENIVDGLRLFPGSLTTDGEDSLGFAGWCQLAYWELTQRVGGKFPVENSSVNVFSGHPRGNGMCLKTLAEQKQSATPEAVQKVRKKIGLGITLSQEVDGVWLYNRSSAPVFIHSPTLNEVHTFNHVCKVPPGHCLRAFDIDRASKQQLTIPTHVAGVKTGPIDTYSMRISFAKGWGNRYSRQDVTACPCWLEVLLSRR